MKSLTLPLLPLLTLTLGGCAGVSPIITVSHAPVAPAPATRSPVVSDEAWLARKYAHLTNREIEVKINALQADLEAPIPGSPGMVSVIVSTQTEARGQLRELEAEMARRRAQAERQPSGQPKAGGSANLGPMMAVAGRRVIPGS